MKWIFLLTVLLFRLPAFAQQDDNILNREDSERLTVSKNRRLLLDKFYATRLDSVTLLLDSIDRRHPDRTFLLPAERLLLYYWIERYDKIEYLARNFEMIGEGFAVNPPPEQMIWNVLLHYSQEKSDMLVSWIEQGAHGDEEFDLLVRLLETLLHHEIEDQSSIEPEIRLLVEQYDRRKTEIQKEIKSFEPRIWQKWIFSDYYDDAPFWGKFGVGCGFGAGPVFFTGKIADNFSAKAHMCLYIHAKYKHLHFSAFVQVGSAVLKRNMLTNGGYFRKVGGEIYISSQGFTVGYSVIETRTVSVAPFAGIAKKPSIDRHGGSSPIIGLDMDLKISNLLHDFEAVLVSSLLNMRLNYFPLMTNPVNKRGSGSMFSITFGCSLSTSEW